MKTNVILWIFVLSLFHLCCCKPKPVIKNRCESITQTICQDIQYKTTIFPNRLGHSSQNAAGIEINHFYPLVKVGCAPNLKLFLCAIYLPKCSKDGSIIPPCRHLCEESKDGCLSLMTQFGFPWPTDLNCEQFPTHSEDITCVKP